MKKSYLNTVLMVLAIIFSLIIGYMLILKIIGHSPTDIIILYSFVGLLITNLFILNYQFGRFGEKLDGLTHQFSSLAHDFKEHLNSKK